jgi:hypothetical protein
MKPLKETKRVEGRSGPEDGLSERAEDRTQSRKRLSSSLARVHEAASRDKKTRFTALLHHVSVEALERAFGRLKRGAAAGVDGETVATYERGLSGKLQDLCDRVHRGWYRPAPVRRVYIPKPDGGQRPLRGVGRAAGRDAARTLGWSGAIHRTRASVRHARRHDTVADMDGTEPRASCRCQSSRGGQR